MECGLECGMEYGLECVRGAFLGAEKAAHCCSMKASPESLLRSIVATF